MPPDNIPEPRVVAPSVNITVPVAVDGVTVAVKVAGLPYADGFIDDVTPVVVVALSTVCEMADEGDSVKFISPP